MLRRSSTTRPGAVLIATALALALPVVGGLGGFTGKRGFRFLIQAVLILFVIALIPTLAFFLGFWLYALNSPVRYVFGLGIRRGKNVAPERTEHPERE